MKVLLFLLAVLIFSAIGWSVSETIHGYRAGKMPVLFARYDRTIVRDEGDNFRFVAETIRNVLGVLFMLFGGVATLYAAMVV